MTYNVQMFPTWPQHGRSSYLNLRSSADSLRCPHARGHVGRSERSERSRKHSCYVSCVAARPNLPHWRRYRPPPDKSEPQLPSMHNTVVPSELSTSTVTNR